MSNFQTKQFIAPYFQSIAPTRFLTGFFPIPAGGIHNQESVELDIQRSDEEVAVVIQDLSTGYRHNEDEKFTNKEFKPPIYKESATLNAFNLINRSAGQNTFDSNDFQAKAMVESFRAFRLLQAKIDRAVEQQASQILQTGQLTLQDQNGANVYLLDYKAKATHFPIAGTAWDQAGATILADLESLAEVLRNDGLSNPTDLIMGTAAFAAFVDDAGVRERYDNRRMDLGMIDPQFNVRGAGATLQGTVRIGNYEFRIWTYSGRFIDPATSIKTEYVSAEKVIMLDSSARLDLTVGSIPKIVEPDSRVMPFLPPVLAQEGSSQVLFTNAWVSADGESLTVAAGARPLCIPTAIDTFGCLDTGL